MIRIGMMGLGTVGSGVFSILAKHGENIARKVGCDLVIDKVLVQEKDKNRGVMVDSALLTDRPADLLDDPAIQLVVELIGGENPAYQFIVDALKRGKSVVTANKLVVAKYGQELFRLARDNRVNISYEGSVAGGIPVIRPLKESFAANRVEKILGILNGTTNYILSKMSKDGQEFETALQEAQAYGYAERDPSSDLSGLDAAYKIAILASIAFETFVDVNSIYVEGIEGIELEDIDIAAELGYVIKLLAIAKNEQDGLDIRVHPAFVAKDHPLALVNDQYNAIYLHGDAVNDVMSYGRGAGQMPTASAVVADMIQVGKDICQQRVDTLNFHFPVEQTLKNINMVENSYYLRLQVNDQPGVLAQITKVLGDNKVSLASVIQKHKLTPVVPIILVTHRVKEEAVNKSIKMLKQLPDVIAINNLIRVEAL
ncbi:MAG: homoserine dehydrogenase [Halanaerobiales bacterium]|nr:homoserine dehydrogenase [Halanaerobiales bacterium]